MFLLIRKFCKKGGILRKSAFHFKSVKTVLPDIPKRRQLLLLEKNLICILDIFLDYIFHTISNLYLHIRLTQFFLSSQIRGGFQLIPLNNLLLNQSVLIISPIQHLHQRDFPAIFYKFCIHCSKSIHFILIDKSITNSEY